MTSHLGAAAAVAAIWLAALVIKVQLRPSWSTAYELGFFHERWLLMVPFPLFLPRSNDETPPQPDPWPVCAGDPLR